MKTTISCLIFFCCACRFLAAQTGYSDAGSRSDAMGNAGVTLADVFSAQNNQAALAFLENAAAGISTQNYFLVEGGISASDAVVAFPLKNSGTIGASVNYTGDATFNQSKIGIAYGQKLAQNVALGIQLDYVGTHTEEVGSGSAFTFDFGVLYKPAKQLQIGAKIFNPLRVKTGLNYEQELPAIMNVGMSYHPSDKIIICAEAEQNIQDDLRAKFGMEYHIVEQLFIRGGYISNPSMFTCGVGVKLKSLSFDLSSQFHPQLGPAPGLGLQYSF